LLLALAPGCPGPAPAARGPAQPRRIPEGLARREADLLREVNQARLAHHLPPADADPDLARLARRQASDLAERGVLSHADALGRDYAERLMDPALGLAGGWRDAGEILARNNDRHPAAAAVRGWLASPAGHRETLLDARWRRVGVGVAQDPQGMYYLAALWAAAGR